jgi:hypothetical protein
MRAGDDIAEIPYRIGYAAPKPAYAVGPSAMGSAGNSPVPRGRVGYRQYRWRRDAHRQCVCHSREDNPPTMCYLI